MDDQGGETVPSRAQTPVRPVPGGKVCWMRHSGFNGQGTNERPSANNAGVTSGSKDGTRCSEQGQNLRTVWVAGLRVTSTVLTQGLEVPSAGEKPVSSSPAAQRTRGPGGRRGPGAPLLLLVGPEVTYSRWKQQARALSSHTCNFGLRGVPFIYLF